MINTVLAALRCPICHAALTQDPGRIRVNVRILGQDPYINPDPAGQSAGPAGQSAGPAGQSAGPAGQSAGQGGGLRCARGHGFDRARQGYVHLGTGRRLPEGDTPEMVAARVAFLEAGHYEPLRAAIAAATPPDAELIVDVGSGPGYYLAAALDRAKGASGLAIDVSKAALKRVKHQRAEAVLADAWSELPLRDGSVDVLLNVFAPRNGQEFARVLKKSGALVVVTPNQDHLKELRAEHDLLDVDPAKDERVAQALKAFEATATEDLSWPLNLTEQEAAALVGMGPNAFHAKTAKATRTRASVRITTYVERSISSQPRGGS